MQNWFSPKKERTLNGSIKDFIRFCLAQWNDYFSGSPYIFRICITIIEALEMDGASWQLYFHPILAFRRGSQFMLSEIWSKP